MATHDTDPDDTLPSAPADSGRGDAAVESLLADLAHAPLPVDGVSQTDGHMAASVAVAAHRPPRATEAADARDAPAVVVNTTQPMGAAVAAPSPGSTITARMPVAHDTVRDTVEDRPRRAANTTTPSARVRSAQRTYLAAAAIGAVAIGTAVPLLLYGRTSSHAQSMEADALPRSASSVTTVAAPSFATAPAAPTAETVATAEPSASAPSVATATPATSSNANSAQRAGAQTPATPPRVLTPQPPVSTATPSATPAAVTTRPATASSTGDFPWRQ